MNTKKTVGTIIIIALVIGLIVWKVLPHKAAQNPADEGTPTTTSIEGAVRNDKGDFEYKKDTDYMSITVIYPSKTDLSTDADAKARLTMESWIKDMVAQFEKENGDATISADEKDRLKSQNRKHEMDIAYQAFKSPGYVSHVFGIFEDTGGAHPNGFDKTMTFDMKGNTIELADLFVPSSRYLDRLSVESYKQILVEAKKRFEADLDADQIDMIRVGTEPSPEALQFFYLDDTDLVLIFPPYQVAAYVAGEFDISIPLSSLSDILKKP